MSYPPETHPLITRLTREFAYPLLDTAEALAAFTQAPGAHLVFVPGDLARNLESPDVAVILPELHQAFQGQFDCAVAGDGIEAQLRADTAIHKTPSLIFFRAGHCLGGLPKVRDWSDYMARIPQLLQAPDATNTPAPAATA